MYKTIFKKFLIIFKKVLDIKKSPANGDFLWITCAQIAENSWTSVKNLDNHTFCTRNCTFAAFVYFYGSTNGA